MLNIRRELSLNILTVFFAGSALLAPILSGRMLDLWGIKIVLGAVFISLACSVLDVINNNWGVQAAKDAVISSIVVRFVMYGLITLSMYLPVFKELPGYEDLILNGVRLLLAAEIATGGSQYFIDIPLFDYMKKRFKHFFVRYNVSNLVSAAVQSVLFVTIGFWGTGLHDYMFDMIWGGYVFKLGFQFVLSPILVSIVGYLDNQDVRDT